MGASLYENYIMWDMIKRFHYSIYENEAVLRLSEKRLIKLQIGVGNYTLNLLTKMTHFSNGTTTLCDREDAKKLKCVNDYREVTCVFCASIINDELEVMIDDTE